MHSPATSLGIPVLLFTQISSQQPGTYGQDNMLKFKWSIRVANRGDLGDLEIDMVVHARCACPSISETLRYKENDL